MSYDANPRLRLANALRQDKKLIGTFAVLSGTRHAQVLAHTGVDMVMIDCEHGHIDDREMHDMVVAISGAGISPAVRVMGDDSTLIKRALDSGVHGILIPMISTASQAKAIVDCSKFPPLGVRGQGSPFACFEFGLDTPKEYVEQANNDLVIMAQIETRDGVNNIEEICQVDGVDLVLIGPNDLALSLLGHLPAQDKDTVYHDAIDTVISTAKKYGKKTGFVVVDGEEARRASAKFDLVILTNEVRAVQAWYKKELAIARA